MSAGDVEGYILHYLTIARSHIPFLCKSHFGAPSEMFYILGQLKHKFSNIEPMDVSSTRLLVIDNSVIYLMGRGGL